MKKNVIFWIIRSIRTVGLAAVLLASACAPTAPPTPIAPPAPTQTPGAASQPQVTTEAAAVQIPQVVATSRGPNLEATDPGTVVLASGNLQLVEFFRFT